MKKLLFVSIYLVLKITFIQANQYTLTNAIYDSNLNAVDSFLQNNFLTKQQKKSYIELSNQFIKACTVKKRINYDQAQNKSHSMLKILGIFAAYEVSQYLSCDDIIKHMVGCFGALLAAEYLFSLTQENLLQLNDKEAAALQVNKLLYNAKIKS